MTLPPDFVELLEALATAKVEYLLVGGYAVAFHGEPRATKDMDLWIGGDPENVERFLRAIAHFGAPPHILEALRTQKDDEFVFMGTPPLRVDFLRSIPGLAFSEAFQRRVSAVWQGITISVLAREDLILAKRAAGRAQDLLDAERLERSR